MSDFQTLMSSVASTTDKNRYSVNVYDTWLQGRTAFGGLSAALVVAAMNKQVAADRRLRACQCFLLDRFRQVNMKSSFANYGLAVL